MRNSVSITVAIAFLTLFIGTAGADEVVPGAYGQPDWSVMSVGKTQMEIGAKDRAHANLVNARSGAYRSASNTGNGGGADFQWGSSQTEQSWKSWRTVADVGVVVGLVPGDCRGDNSDGVYRKQMNQNRKGYMSEPIVTQAQCTEYHTTNK